MTRDRIEDLMIESGLALHLSDADTSIAEEIAVQKFARLLEGEARAEILQEMVEGMRREQGDLRTSIGRTLHWWMSKYESTRANA